MINSGIAWRMTSRSSRLSGKDSRHGGLYGSREDSRSNTGSMSYHGLSPMELVHM